MVNQILSVEKCRRITKKHREKIFLGNAIGILAEKPTYLGRLVQILSSADQAEQKALAWLGVPGDAAGSNIRGWGNSA